MKRGGFGRLVSFKRRRPEKEPNPATRTLASGEPKLHCYGKGGGAFCGA